MSQTFKKKTMVAALAVALSVAAVGVSAPAFANQFEGSSFGAVTAKTLKRGGIPREITGLALTEVGTWSNSATTVAASNPTGFTLKIPAGIDLYGSWVGVAIDATATVAAQGTKFTPTAGYTYPIRFTAGAAGKESYVFIDTSKGTTSPAVDGTFTATTWAANTLLAIFAVDGSAAGVDLGLANSRLKAGAGSSAALTDLFAGGLVASGTGSTVTANATSQAKLLVQNGNATTATVGSTTTDVIGTVKAESDGSLTFQFYANDLDTGADTLATPTLFLGASTTATLGNNSVALADGIGATPLTSSLIGLTPTSKAVAVVSQYAAVVAKSVSTDVVPTVVKGLVGQNSLAIKLTFAEAITTATGNKITVRLDNGAKFKAITAGSAYSTVGTDSVTDTPTVGTNAAGDLEISFTNASSVAVDETLTIDIASLLDLSGMTNDGAINATVTGNFANNDIGTQTIQIATAASRSTTVTYSDVAPTGYDTLYVGRSSVTAPTDKVVLTEYAAGSLAPAGSVSLALSNGVKFTAGTITPTIAKVSDGTACSQTIVGAITTTSATTATGAVAGTATDAACKVTLGTGTLDLLSATPGDLTVTVSGTGGASGSVKVATLANSATASASGAVPTVTAGSSVALPDVVITETDAGAIEAGLGVIAAPTTSVTSFDVTGSVVKAFTASGTDVSSTFVGSAVKATAVSGASGTALVTFTTLAKSGTSYGPLTYKVSGLKATVASGAVGDVNVTVAGGASGTLDLSTTPTGGTTTEISGAVGAKVTKQSVKVASVVSSTNPSYPTATVADQKALTLAGLPLVAAGNDQGKQGSVYVALIYQGSVFFLGSNSTWSQFTSAATVPAYSTGTLGTTTLNIVPTAIDVTAYKGAQFVVGYGLGIAGLSNPFDDFIKNARYNVIYTVQ